VLRPGGTIVVTTPNYYALRGRVWSPLRFLSGRGGGLTVASLLSTPTLGHHWKEYSCKELKDYFAHLSADFRIQKAVALGVLLRPRDQPRFAFNTDNVLCSSRDRQRKITQAAEQVEDFVGSAPGLSSSVFTMMSSMMVAPKIPIVRPYFVLGVGLIRTNVEITAANLLLGGGGNNNFGWNIGGGIMLGSQHVAVRGDIRFIHAFDDFELLGIPLSDTDLDFGRASLGLFLSF
jgi:hypothetical protein